jgi:hypothetical protein
MVALTLLSRLPVTCVEVLTIPFTIGRTMA